ncbi:hypothetical protein EOI86_05995 [Hwanghaeella grinnelliae]|uniref:Uncharacterized protein n=1 Tax=Hwanghaeella grinnelliae TaxID=2500179 RepID=A0A437QWA8_9PROT|nr:hypothetical protein [Hwanghaeella grinnelliae]RVU38817.1 hypothetical protein EOI86_05995 [Hwanghaeella grinnelliae]
MSIWTVIAWSLVAAILGEAVARYGPGGMFGAFMKATGRKSRQVGLVVLSVGLLYKAMETALNLGIQNGSLTLKSIQDIDAFLLDTSTLVDEFLPSPAVLFSVSLAVIILGILTETTLLMVRLSRENNSEYSGAEAGTKGDDLPLSGIKRILDLAFPHFTRYRSAVDVLVVVTALSTSASLLGGQVAAPEGRVRASINGAYGQYLTLNDGVEKHAATEAAARIFASILESLLDTQDLDEDDHAYVANVIPHLPGRFAALDLGDWNPPPPRSADGPSGPSNGRGTGGTPTEEKPRGEADGRNGHTVVDPTQERGSTGAEISRKVAPFSEMSVSEARQAEGWFAKDYTSAIQAMAEEVGAPQPIGKISALPDRLATYRTELLDLISASILDPRHIPAIRAASGGDPFLDIALDVVAGGIQGPVGEYFSEALEQRLQLIKSIFTPANSPPRDASVTAKRTLPPIAGQKLQELKARFAAGAQSFVTSALERIQQMSGAVHDIFLRTEIEQVRVGTAELAAEFESEDPKRYRDLVNKLRDVTGANNTERPGAFVTAMSNFEERFHETQQIKRTRIAAAEAIIDGDADTRWGDVRAKLEYALEQGELNLKPENIARWREIWARWQKIRSKEAYLLAAEGNSGASWQEGPLEEAFRRLVVADKEFAAIWGFVAKSFIEPEAKEKFFVSQFDDYRSLAKTKKKFKSALNNGSVDFMVYWALLKPAIDNGSARNLNDAIDKFEKGFLDRQYRFQRFETAIRERGMIPYFGLSHYLDTSSKTEGSPPLSQLMNSYRDSDVFNDTVDKYCH